MQDKLNRLDDIPDAFTLKVEGSLLQLFKLLLIALSLDQNSGNVVRSNANIIAINTTLNRYRDLFYDSDYVKAVKDFSKEFTKQKEINDLLLRGLGYATTQTNLAILASDFVFTSTRRRAIELLIGDANVESRFFSIIRQTLLDSVNTETPYTTMVSMLSEVVLGNEKRDGQLLNWSKQVAHDSFALSDRAYSTSIGKELGVEWWKYAGGLIQDRREFCVDKNGKFYHTSEIELWPTTEGDWAGRMPNTNSSTIFEKVGGFKCNHSLVFVSEAIVPQADLDRIKKTKT